MTQGNWRRNLTAQLAYSGGRIATYAFLGALAGQLGQTLSQQLGSVVQISAALCIIAGLFLIVEGLAAAGFELRWWRANGGVSTGRCAALPLMTVLLRVPGPQRAFTAGLLTGFIPCGLLYAFIALAATTGHFATGMLLMGLFGLGTVPLMFLTGVTTSLLNIVYRRRIMYVAAWSVVLTGVITVARGTGFIRLPSVHAALNCPFCAGVDVQPDLRTAP
jgi:sulfite exporter TauE/SafE